MTKEWDLSKLMDTERINAVDASIPGSQIYGQSKTNWLHNNGVAERDNYLVATARWQGVFGYDKKIHTLIKDFVNESSSQIPYMNSLMLCLLQETIIRLMQHEFVGPSTQEKPVTEARQHYQDELLERILQYIGDNLHDPLTIAEICHKFSMSRSSLQILFKENLNQTPKKYISELKLERSCQLLREGRYTVSEIAFMLGFNSIHYFSRAFTKKYNMAPSDYSKQLFKN